MGKFKEYFDQPFWFDDNSLVIDGSYTKEKAVELIVDDLKQYLELGETRDWNIKFEDLPDLLEVGYVKFCGGRNEDNEWVNAWWVKDKPGKHIMTVWITPPLYCNKRYLKTNDYSHD